MFLILFVTNVLVLYAIVMKKLSQKYRVHFEISQNETAILLSLHWEKT